MGRRIKEEPSVHRLHIATAAGELFKEKGIEATSVNEIAKQAGYSKATIYVYFKNKEEIVEYLVLHSMVKLKEYLVAALESDTNGKEKFFKICQALVQYEEEYPFYFSLVLDHINIDFEQIQCEDSENETYRVGEEINQIMYEYFVSEINKGILKKREHLTSCILNIWGMISGSIQLASKKQEYISYAIKQNKQEFLQEGWNLIYDAIKAE